MVLTQFFSDMQIDGKLTEKLIRGQVYDLLHKREAQGIWQGHLVLVLVTLLKKPQTCQVRV